MTDIHNCFANALKDESKGKKHKGLLITVPNEKLAKEYIIKAKKNLQLCYLFKDQGFDYKIPEEWFYTLYYCALAILAKLGIESRSQRCTALFLRYAKESMKIDYDLEFIDRITVYSDKEKESDVDFRENSRYGSSIKSEEISKQFDTMTEICKKAISQCEEIIYSNKHYSLPEELRKELLE